MASTVEELTPIGWPVLGIFGAEDKVIPLEKVEEFRSSLTTLGIPHDIHIYPGVGHAFANPSGANYAPEETKDAWQKTLTFLRAHLQ
jgi:carboxymethylenebutenolidase